MDAQVIRLSSENPSARNTGYATQPPLQRFLASCYEEFKSDNSGTVADYIPELKRANPAHLGIALVTIDGHIYEVGDSAVPFTIQSVSKPFVFALALEMVGEERVAAAIGVEPSGEAFNSIRLTNDNRPFNPMVNAGAIACSGLTLSSIAPRPAMRWPSMMFARTGLHRFPWASSRAMRSSVAITA